MPASDLLTDLSERGFRLLVLADDKLRVTPADRLTDADRDAIRQHKAALLRLLTADYVAPWTDTEIAVYIAREQHLQRLGLDAERMAERLLHRDRDGDDRRLCAECAGFDRSTRHCTRWRRAGMVRSVHPLPDVLQRCPGFHLHPTLAAAEPQS
jgi:hypothetical protein